LFALSAFFADSWPGGDLLNIALDTVIGYKKSFEQVFYPYASGADFHPQGTSLRCQSAAH